jgi:hypothetical protein
LELARGLDSKELPRMLKDIHRLKPAIGIVFFLSGLFLLIDCVTKQKSSWWWGLGIGSLLLGLDYIIDSRIEEAKKAFFDGQ